MELKKLSIDDIDDIKKVILDAFTGEPWNDDWQDPEQFHRYILDLIGNANSLALGLVNQEKIVAVALGRIKHWYTGNQYWIDDLGVISDCRGKGYGTAFLSLMEQYLRKNSVKKIVLLTERDIPAFYFYKKNHFELKEERVVYEKEF